MATEIREGDQVVAIVYPHKDRTGEITCAVEIDGKMSYNVWFHDGETLGFWEGEIVLIEEYEG